MIDLPSVLVFTITYSGKDYVYKEFCKYAEDLNYPNMRHIWIDNSDDGGEYYNKLLADGHEAYHVKRGNNSREALTRSQEFARRMALDEGYDYLMSIESDILMPPNVIQTLMGRAKEMVGSLYMIGPPENRWPCVTVSKTDPRTGLVGSRLLLKEEFPDFQKKHLMAVNGCGLGCTLIERHVIEKIKFTYYPDLKGHSDIFFSNDVWKYGMRVFVDTSIICAHKNVPWSGVKDR